MWSLRRGVPARCLEHRRLQGGHRPLSLRFVRAVRRCVPPGGHRQHRDHGCVLPPAPRPAGPPPGTGGGAPLLSTPSHDRSQGLCSAGTRSRERGRATRLAGTGVQRRSRRRRLRARSQERGQPHRGDGTGSAVRRQRGAMRRLPARRPGTGDGPGTGPGARTQTQPSSSRKTAQGTTLKADTLIPRRRHRT